MKGNVGQAQRVTTIWTSFLLCYFKALYESIPKRYWAALIANRKLTKYQFFFLYFLDRKALNLHFTVVYFTVVYFTVLHFTKKNMTIYNACAKMTNSYVLIIYNISTVYLYISTYISVYIWILFHGMQTSRLHISACESAFDLIFSGQSSWAPIILQTKFQISSSPETLLSKTRNWPKSAVNWVLNVILARQVILFFFTWIWVGDCVEHVFWCIWSPL